MTLRIRLRSAAENDVRAHAQFLQERSVEAAVHFLDAFDASIALLTRSPGIGGICGFKNPVYDAIRVWPVASFKSHLIFYRILADEIEVVRVVHGARDLNAIFDESD